MVNALDPATRNLINRETDSQSKQLARNSASDLVDTLLQDNNKLKGLKGHTLESLANTHKEQVDKSVFLLSQFVLKSNDHIKIREFKDNLKREITANKNITVDDFFKLISKTIENKVWAEEFAQWKEEYLHKHPEGLEKGDMKARMDAQTAVMGEVLKWTRTTNTYRYVLHVIADIKEKYQGSPREIAVRIINYIRGIKSKNWIRNNRITNRAKSAWRNKGLLWSGLASKNMDKEVGDIVKSMTLTPKDRNPRTGQPNKNGLAKLTVAKELETAYKIARNEQEVSANAFDLAA